MATSDKHRKQPQEPDPKEPDYIDYEYPQDGKPPQKGSIFRTDGRRNEELFPKYYEIENGVPIIPEEFILITKPGADVSFLEKSKKYRITKDGVQFDATISKLRQCGPNARAIMLLKGTRVLSESTGSGDDPYQVFEIGSDGASGGTSKGIIQPEPAGTGGGSGGASSPGGTSGYPNAYGLSRPVSTVRTRSIRDFLGRIKDIFESLFGPYARDEAKKAIKVAVLDTGHRLLPDWDLKGQSCGAWPFGWDFVDPETQPSGDPFPEDRHAAYHGTRISHIIRQRFGGARIVPVKIASDNGVCELFDVLCGLEYARVQGCQVVNASFIFPANRGTRIHLLDFMIKTLTDNGIWIVAAAGNAGTYLSMSPGDSAHLGQEGGPLLYPACYSLDAEEKSGNTNKVITVTTVGRRRGAAGPVNNAPFHQTTNSGGALILRLCECFSPEFVDIGVVTNGRMLSADGDSDDEFGAPGFAQSARGTSYATPHIAGLVARELSRTPNIGKQELLKKIKTQIIPDFETGIRRGFIRS